MKFIAIIACAGLAAACASTSGSAPSPTTTTTTANISAVTNDHAIDEITNARCAREFSCDNIGAGRVWTDYGACKRDVRLSMRDALTGQVCASGVDAFRLSSCLEDIRNNHCAAVQGTVEHFGSCTNARLCR